MTNIDYEVAEKIMEWKFQPEEYGVCVEPLWILPNDHYRTILEWNPSTNISDAWLVVEKMRELDYEYSIWWARNTHQVEFYPKREEIKYTGKDKKSLSLAICKAALKALEEK